MELAYEYAFLKRDNYEVAASIGIHDLRFDLNLEAPADRLGRAARPRKDGQRQRAAARHRGSRNVAPEQALLSRRASAVLQDLARPIRRPPGRLHALGGLAGVQALSDWESATTSSSRRSMCRTTDSMGACDGSTAGARVFVVGSF